MATANQ